MEGNGNKIRRSFHSKQGEAVVGDVRNLVPVSAPVTRTYFGKTFQESLAQLLVTPTLLLFGTTLLLFGYAYSAANKTKAEVWEEKTYDYLLNPKKEGLVRLQSRKKSDSKERQAPFNEL